MDIVGYDKDKNLWIVELKDSGNPEKLGDIIKQVDDYKNNILVIKKDLEDDFEKTFYFKIEFKNVKKLILAPKKFYDNKKRDEFNDKTVEYAYFKDRNITKTKKLCNIVDVRIEEKSKWN